MDLKLMWRFSSASFFCLSLFYTWPDMETAEHRSCAYGLRHQVPGTGHLRTRCNGKSTAMCKRLNKSAHWVITYRLDPMPVRHQVNRWQKPVHYWHPGTIERQRGTQQRRDLFFDNLDRRIAGTNVDVVLSNWPLDTLVDIWRGPVRDHDDNIQSPAWDLGYLGIQGWLWSVLYVLQTRYRSVEQNDVAQCPAGTKRLLTLYSIGHQLGL